MLLGTEMDSGHAKMRMNVHGDDRLSSLPDELIHKILYSFDIKEVIETSCLSSRWRYIWTSMPYLNFSSRDFSKLPEFPNFVTHVLSCRNNHAQVYSLNFNYPGMTRALVKRILSYAFSHNIRQLNVEGWFDSSRGFPFSLLTSQSLQQLSLAIRGAGYVTSAWELPSLTTLYLQYVKFCDDKCINVFLKCANLKNLTLTDFVTNGSNGFSIIHPRLSNLTLENGQFVKKVFVNVAAPQLKNLNIIGCHVKFVIYAPNLASLRYKGNYELNPSTDGFRSLEMADICITHPKDAIAHKIVSLLQLIHNVNFLSLNVALVEFLSSSAGPIVIP